MENLYNVLGVAPNASDDEIKKVYRSLAMRFHPDRNQAPGAEARFKSVTKAYEILADPAKRAEYDQSVNHRIIIDAGSGSLSPCGAALFTPPRYSHYLPSLNRCGPHQPARIT